MPILRPTALEIATILEDHCGLHCSCIASPTSGRHRRERVKLGFHLTTTSPIPTSSSHQMVRSKAKVYLEEWVNISHGFILHLGDVFQSFHK